MSGLITRFAPSPTGHLHLGHAFSVLLAWDLAENVGGRFLLRIEDIDSSRCRPEFEKAIYKDLSWLGVAWENPVRRQSDHLDDYQRALEQLHALGVLYPCFCSRKEIQREFKAAGAAPHPGEYPVYPGTCRRLSNEERILRLKTANDGAASTAWRLDIGKAWNLAGGNLSWMDRIVGPVRATPGHLGDVVVARKDIGTSYHVAVTVDDAIQNVNLVVRGEDLFETTHIHRLLQELLGLPTPEYLHHPLVTDPDGRRLAKRDHDAELQILRSQGWSTADVRHHLGRNHLSPSPHQHGPSFE